ncbi:hypothetical protein HDK90DRAFT_315635 [Phyllosticta capitalensis]|uniref:NACHT domain-containing protein n=1 Tax=Phyllosticta capitalensis TaxID=121624 RepID=A0ABR1YM14_9PEZI
MGNDSVIAVSTSLSPSPKLANNDGSMHNAFGSVSLNASAFIANLVNYGTVTQVGSQVINNYVAPDPRTTESGKRDALVNWLAPRDYTQEYPGFSDKAARGTGRWFLESEPYASWRRRETRHLWCSGKPGAGKSILTSIVIKELKRGSKDCRVAFLYLSYKQQKASLTELLGGLASQLIGSPWPACVQHVWNQEKDKPNPFGSHPELSQVEDLLSELAAAKDTFLIVDALDEFDPSLRQGLVNRLCRIKNASVLVTSRDQMAEGFEESVEIVAQDADVLCYVSLRISEEERLRRYVARDPSLRAEIDQAICEKVNGMFLLARCHMDTLASMVSTGEVRRALQKLPSDPDAMYTDALKRINAQHISKRQWALSILGWMVHMQRPLQLDELRHALLIGDNMGNGALQPGDPPFFDHSYLLSREDILAFSCGLVEIDANNDDTVKLIHFTAQEFFDERRVEYFPNFHARIALACAKYLCLPRLEVADPDRPEERQYGEYTSSDLRDGPNDYTEEFREYERLRDYSKCKEEIRLGKRIDKLDEYEYIVRHVIVPKNVDCRRPWGPLPAKDYTNGSGVLRVLNPGEKLWLYPFTVYAGNFMAHHFRNIGDDDSRAVVEDQTRMLWERPQKLALQKWIICKLSWDIGLQLETLTDYAAFVGSPRLLELYSKGLPIAVREKALEIAIQNGCSHVVKALLSTGSLVNLTSFNGHCLLLGAAQKGFLREVNEVVCSIADSLERAKRYRKSRTVMTRTKDWFDGQPRLDTSKHGQHFPGLSMIKLEAYIRLLEASASGNAAAVRQLFENQSVDAAISADPAAKVKPNKVLEIETKAHLVKTSFFLCAENSHEQAVEVLLDNGIDVDARDNEWQTPLLRAVYRDSWPIMKLLLRKGATIDWRMWMIDERPDRGEVLKLLHKISPDSGLPAVRHAVGRGDLGLLQQLLGLGLNPTTRDWDGDTPLHLACEFGLVEFIGPLIQAGTPPSIRNPSGKTPLHHALSMGEAECAKYLLEHGADISARDHNGDTPLHSAARFPKEESVQVLLEAGADCNALSWQNKTPLDEACRDYIVDLLVKYGAKTGSRLTKSVSKTPGLNPTQPKAGPATILARPTQVRNFSRLLKHPG